MKKILIIIITICMIASFAFAEENPLAGLDLDQLRQMQLLINKEIMSRDSWEGVDIPAGVWTVGVDIPAGTYSISIIDKGGAYLNIQSPSILTDYFSFHQGIRKDTDNIGKIELKDGYTVTIEDGALRFAPPVTLGF